MSTNHFHVLANGEAWVVTLGGLHQESCDSQSEGYREALSKATELGSGEIYVHDVSGDLAWRESIQSSQRSEYPGVPEE